MVGSLKMKLMVFSARLSTAETLKRRPPAMSCVSPAVLVRVMEGGVKSRWIPPGLRVVSHAPAHRARTETTTPQSTVPRACCMCSPGLLTGGRHQVVDDVRRDQNQQIAPILRLGREAEQLAQDREIYKKRDSRLGYRDRGHGQAPDDRRFAVGDQDLVVRLLGLEREADVHRRRLHARVLG